MGMTWGRNITWRQRNTPRPVKRERDFSAPNVNEVPLYEDANPLGSGLQDSFQSAEGLLRPEPNKDKPHQHPTGPGEYTVPDIGGDIGGEKPPVTNQPPTGQVMNPELPPGSPSTGPVEQPELKPQVPLGNVSSAEWQAVLQSFLQQGKGWYWAQKMAAEHFIAFGRTQKPQYELPGGGGQWVVTNTPNGPVWDYIREQGQVPSYGPPSYEDNLKKFNDWIAANPRPTYFVRSGMPYKDIWWWPEKVQQYVKAQVPDRRGMVYLPWEMRELLQQAWDRETARLKEQYLGRYNPPPPSYGEGLKIVSKWLNQNPRPEKGTVFTRGSIQDWWPDRVKAHILKYSYGTDKPVPISNLMLKLLQQTWDNYRAALEKQYLSGGSGTGGSGTGGSGGVVATR